MGIVYLIIIEIRSRKSSKLKDLGMEIIKSNFTRFSRTFLEWKTLLNQCIDANREHFECNTSENFYKIKIYNKFLGRPILGSIKML